MDKINVYLETGEKKTFAGSLDWPGWTRVGKDAQSALDALAAYGPRYAKVLTEAGIAFKPPTDAEALVVVERLKGDATTDFGAPSAIPVNDTKEVDEAEYRRFEAILRACWQALDAAVQAAQGKELRKGPRGGGRELEGIIGHVLDANGGYLSSLCWKKEKRQEANLQERMKHKVEAVLEGLGASVRGEIPAQGPRGGQRWPARYFVRRLAWHVLDHVWEIEDRIN